MGRWLESLDSRETRENTPTDPTPIHISSASAVLRHEPMALDL